MLFARNHFGELTNAGDAGRGWYSCPTCGQAVFLKSGSIYEPHFAHRAHVALPECELFHPARSYTGSTSQSYGPTRTQRPPWVSPNLYLAPVHAGFELSLLLPLHRPAPKWEGHISYADHRGIQRFASAAFEGRTRLRVLPRRDPYTFDKEGDVAPAIWTSLQAGIEGFSDRNVFYWSEVGGRRLERNAPMEWGERYWLVMPSAETLDDIASPFCEPVGGLETWVVYEVLLPSVSIVATWSTEEREHLEDWFFHPIREPITKVWIRTPFPLYSREDMWVFPDAKHFQISTVGPSSCALALEETVEGQRSALKRVGANDWAVDGLGVGLYTAYLNERAALSFEVVAEHALYAPGAIEVVIRDEKYPLYDALEPITLLRKEGAIESVVLTTPEGLPPEFVRINGEPWAGDDLASVLREFGRALTIDGGAFGTIKVSSRTRVSTCTSVDGGILQTATWLLSLPRPRDLRGAVAFPASVGALPIELKPLLDRKWSAKYSPHLINLWRILRDRIET